MKPNRLLLLLTLSLLPGFAMPALTLDECISKARENYPQIRQYDLLDASKEIDLSEINKSWLPKIDIYAQSTLQNVVPAYPEALSNMLQQMGQNVAGLSRFQYKAGADINQTIWDGGISKARREASRSKDAVERASVDVELYAIRSRVQNLFFAILLTESRIRQASVTLNLLSANAERLASMYRNGTAMKADVDMVEAQKLSVGQTITACRTSVDAYRRMLALFIGEETDDIKLVAPPAIIPDSDESFRPELTLLQSRIDAGLSSLRLSETSVMPRIGLFAQAFYGYPGFDYFQSMMSRNPSFNLIGGIRLNWNIDAFYTRHDNRQRTSLSTSRIEAERETFLFNTSLQCSSKRESIEGIRRLIADDEEIIRLRSDVRKAAESQLSNGVIDATALLSKISDEETANLDAAYHKIQLLQEIHELKYILNQ